MRRAPEKAAIPAIWTAAYSLVALLPRTETARRYVQGVWYSRNADCTIVVQVRPIWILEELGLPYTIVPVDFSPEFRQTEEWRNINPVGKVPAMTDGDLTMFESVAMMQYILDRYGGGRLQPTPGTPYAISVHVCFHRSPPSPLNSYRRFRLKRLSIAVQCSCPLLAVVSLC